MGEAEGSASIHDVDDLYSEAYPGKHIEVSDVVMLNRDGVMFCYFRDEKGFCLIEGFIQNSDSDAANKLYNKRLYDKGYGRSVVYSRVPERKGERTSI
jgi:hypothetical protein